MDGLQVCYNPTPQPHHFGGGQMHEEVMVLNNNTSFGN